MIGISTMNLKPTDNHVDLDLIGKLVNLGNVTDVVIFSVHRKDDGSESVLLTSTCDDDSDIMTIVASALRENPDEFI
jgi:hypothetical protein